MTSLETSNKTKENAQKKRAARSDLLLEIEIISQEISDGIAKPAELLKFKFLNTNSILLFERFVQAVLTAYKSRSPSDRDWQRLSEFVTAPSPKHSGEAAKRRLVFRTIISGLGAIAPRVEGLLLEPSRISALKLYRGCIEVNPHDEMKHYRSTETSVTFVAFRDGFTGSEFVPQHLGGTTSRRYFQNQIRSMLEQRLRAYFTNVTDYKNEIEDIGTVVSELYSNTVVHAMPARKQEEFFSDPDDPEANLRVLRFSSHIFANVSQLSSYFDKHFPDFHSVAEYGKSLKRLFPRGGIKIVTVSVLDNGPTILRHYEKIRGEMPGSLSEKDRFEKVVTTQLSSSDKPGAGDGLRNALVAVQNLNGFLSVRSGPFWATLSSTSNTLTLSFESDKRPTENMNGTCYTIVLPRSLRT